MPREGVGLFVRPNFDSATSYGFYYIGLAEAYAASRNMLAYDLASGNANKANIFAALEGEDPIFCYFNGHGNADTYTAQNAEVVMITCSGDERLIGRVILLLSCSCGVRIAPSAVSKGAIAVYAWTVDFTWVAVGGPPDEMSRGFFESVNAVSNALAEGKTTQEAMNLSMASWNLWIDYWMGHDDPYASQVVQWLIHDRDGQTLFGDTTARITTPTPPPPPTDRIPIPIPSLTGFIITFLSFLAG